MHLGLSLGLGGGGQGAGRPMLDLNFLNESYTWLNRPRAFSAFTVAAGTPTVETDGLKVDSGDRLNLTDLSWFNGSQGTFAVEWTRAVDATATPTLLSLSGRGVEIFQGSAAGTYEASGFNADNNFVAGSKGSKKQRLILAYSVGGRADAAYNNDTIATNSATLAAALTPTAVGFGYRIALTDAYMTTGRLERVRYWPRRLSQAEIASAMQVKVAGKKHIHLLGDSFVNTPNLMLIRDNFLDDYRIYTVDGVGGSTILEQAARFALTPTYHDRLVVHVDGGLSDSQTAAVNGALEIKAMCSAGTYLYAEPVPTVNAGTPQRATHDATVSAVVAAVGSGLFVPTLAALQAANDGSANDLADVANGLVPRSLRSDAQHLNTAGWTVYAAQIASKITALGW